MPPEARIHYSDTRGLVLSTHSQSRGEGGLPKECEVNSLFRTVILRVLRSVQKKSPQNEYVLNAWLLSGHRTQGAVSEAIFCFT